MRNLYWDSQIAEKLSVLNPFITQFLHGTGGDLAEFLKA